MIKKLLAVAFSCFALTGYSQVVDSNYFMVAGVIKPVYDTITGTNTWVFLNDNDHSHVNIDFGVMDGLVNPCTTDFGISANFWVIGIFKR